MTSRKLTRNSTVKGTRSGRKRLATTEDYFLVDPGFNKQKRKPKQESNDDSNSDDEQQLRPGKKQYVVRSSNFEDDEEESNDDNDNDDDDVDDNEEFENDDEDVVDPDKIQSEISANKGRIQPSLAKLLINLNQKIPDVNIRVTKIEETLKGMQEQFQRFTSSVGGKGCAKTDIEFTSAQIAQIGIAVREEMFRSIKILDKNTMKVQGDKIFARCALKAGIELDGAPVFNSVIRLVRQFLNRHKAHCRTTLRQTAACKKCFFFIFVFFDASNATINFCCRSN